jgi:hypothetical protein
VPKGLADVVHAAVEHDLEARIPTCLELARRLLEAHPVRGLRANVLSVAEAADTWADSSTRSPYASEDPTESTANHDAEPLSRTDVMTAPSPEDSLTIDVDVALEPTPPPSAGAHRRTPELSRSGIRSPSQQPADDGVDDAPQFFDRKSLPSSGPTPGPGPTPGSSPRSSAAVFDPRTAITGRIQQKSLLAQAAPGAVQRIPLQWMALAFILLGLVVVAALALR